MNQKNKKIIISAIIALIILVGIVVANINGFYKELRYAGGQRIDINIEQTVDQAKIKEIADEVLGFNNMVQVVEIYDDVVTIRARSISEEQKNSIVNKIKENYEIEQTAEKTEIETVPETRIRDMFKQYIIPCIISGALVVAYMAIRYYKKGILKVIGNSIIIPVVAELLLISWMAIVGIPIGRFTPALVILVYVISIWYTMQRIEK